MRKATSKIRKDGLYQRSVTIGKKPDGKPDRRVVYAKDPDELEEKVVALKEELKNGTLYFDKRTTFEDQAKIWGKSNCVLVENNTWIGYESILNKYLLPNLGSIKLIYLKASHLEHVINKYATIVKSDGTLRKIKNIAKQIMKSAKDSGIVQYDVFQRIKSPKIPRRVRRALTTLETNLVIRTYTEHSMGIPAIILLFSGIRRGELLALTWSDVDFEKMKIVINKAVIFQKGLPSIGPPKTKASYREIPIPQSVIEVLKNAKSESKSCYICPNQQGVLMTSKEYESTWSNYIRFLKSKACGYSGATKEDLKSITRISAHMFRHRYATFLYNLGIQAYAASVLLGHADEAITLEVYVHLDSEKVEEAIIKLDNHLIEKGY